MHLFAIITLWLSQNRFKLELMDIIPSIIKLFRIFINAMFKFYFNDGSLQTE